MFQQLELIVVVLLATSRLPQDDMKSVTLSRFACCWLNFDKHPVVMRWVIGENTDMIAHKWSSLLRFCAMDAITEGPALKKQRLSEVKQDNLAPWLGVHIQPLCSKSQMEAVQTRLSSLTKDELWKIRPDALDYAIQKDIEDDKLRMRVVLALDSAIHYTSPPCFNIDCFEICSP